MLLKKLLILKLTYLICFATQSQNKTSSYQVEMGIANSAKISRSVMKPYNYLNLKSGWSDWVGFFNTGLFINAKKKNNQLKIAYISTNYSINYQFNGQFYDSATHSTTGSGGADGYISTNDFSLIFKRNLTPKSRLKLYAGIGFNLIVNKNKSKESAVLTPPVFSPKLRMDARMTDGFEKRIGYATCSEFTLQYPYKKTIFYLTYYLQLGLHYFASNNIYYKFDNYKFQGTIETKGDAMMLGMGLSRQLNFQKKGPPN